MKKGLATLTVVVAVLSLLLAAGCKKDQAAEQGTAPAPSPAGIDTASAAVASTETKDDGRALFQAHCAICHPGGGNIINPQRTLDGESLAANGIETVGDIIETVRRPGPGMTPFDQNTLSDRQAARIAEYIFKTY